MEVTFFQRVCVFTFTTCLETLQTQIHLQLNVQLVAFGSLSMHSGSLVLWDFSFLICP